LPAFQPANWVPPLPLPSESLAGGGFCKKCLQNIDIKELRGKILRTKGLGRRRRDLRTIAASIMIA